MSEYKVTIEKLPHKFSDHACAKCGRKHYPDCCYSPQMCEQALEKLLDPTVDKRNSEDFGG